MRRNADDDLLSAFVDGVSELSLDDRRRLDDLLARDPELREEHAATRDLIDRLRELPPVVDEPDWTALERSIRDAVGPDVPRPRWWPRVTWRWIVPGVALATAAALLALVLHDPAERATSTAPVALRDPPSAPVDDTVLPLLPLWLDGDEVALDKSADDLLDDFSAVLDVADGELEDQALLPSTELEWIEDLDDDALARAERWLDRPRLQRKRS